MKQSLAVITLSLGAFGYAVFGGQEKPKDVDFDHDVRPILARHCFKCHGPDAASAAAGLRLDSFPRATMTLADGNRAIVPGSPAHSWLFQRVENPEPALRMPPPGTGVLPVKPEEVAILKAWVAKGARFEQHWSFLPPVMPVLPAVKDPIWTRNPIDRLLLYKMQTLGLKPEPEADRDTLALRAAETLTGLPPTSEELGAYRRDQNPGAYERYVDRLIAKPEYGEHQARYWLDAIRYADTHGLQLDNERSIYPYRDWIIRAFNQDLPFDKFVEWQLAGDLLPNPTSEQLIATGYVRSNLTSNEGGAIDAEFLARNTFDRVDTTSTVFLGLTIGCARCHDHKYDPIKQRDYYGLYAFFDSTQDAPLDGNIALPTPVVPAPTKQQAGRLADMDRSLAQIRVGVDPSIALAWCRARRDVIPATRDWQVSPVYSSETFDQAFARPEPAEPGQTGPVAWKPMKFEPGKAAVNIIGKDNSSIYLRGVVNYPAARTETLRVSSDDAVKLWLNGKPIHSHKVNRGLDEGIDEVKADFQAGDNQLVAKVVNGGGPDGINIRIGNADQARINAAVDGYLKATAAGVVILNGARNERSEGSQPSASAGLPRSLGSVVPPSPRDDDKASRTRQDLVSTYLDVGPATDSSMAYRKLEKDRAMLVATIPSTLIAQEMPTPRPTFILKRGQYDQPGDQVQRHLPPALCDYSGAPKPGGRQDRLTFARWLVSPSNPLVARVYVNRVWQQFFGVGLVKTSEDFGSQGEWPVNQPLLDFLAVNFMREGWSVKRLNRLIVTSAAFRQSSRITPAKLAHDPENRYCDRGPRFRLDAEVIRDKALVAGGLLDQEIGGRGFKPYQPDGLWEAASDPASGTHFYKRDHDASIYRRSMYMFWKRTSPPPVMTTFDAPNRDTCTVRRSTTNTPLQALTLLNETAFLEAARTMAAGIIRAAPDDPARLRLACDIALGHPPDKTQSTVLLHALAGYRKIYDANPNAAAKLLAVGDAPQVPKIPAPAQAAWMIVCSTLMNTDDFLTVH